MLPEKASRAGVPRTSDLSSGSSTGSDSGRSGGEEEDGDPEREHGARRVSDAALALAVQTPGGDDGGARCV